MKKAPVIFFITFLAFFTGIIYLSRFYHVGRVSYFKSNFMVGMILSGSHDDAGLSQVHYDAVIKSVEKNNLILEYFEKVPYDERCSKKIEELINDGCNLIILDSGFYEEYALAASKNHSDIYFMNAYGEEYRDNLMTYAGRFYQACYLTGIVAGMQTENNHIGYIVPAPAPELICDVNAFTLGVQKVNPEAEVTLAFSDADGGKTSVLKLIENVKTDVIAVDDFDDDILKYADNYGVWTIGCNRDNSALYPETYLTAAVWNWDEFYEDKISECIRGVFRGEEFWIGIDRSVVDICPLTGNVKPGIEEAADKERQRLLNREFDVFYGPVYDREGNLMVEENLSMPDSELFTRFNWYVRGVALLDETNE